MFELHEQSTFKFRRATKSTFFSMRTMKRDMKFYLPMFMGGPKWGGGGGGCTEGANPLKSKVAIGFLRKIVTVGLEFNCFKSKVHTIRPSVKYTENPK